MKYAGIPAATNPKAASEGTGREITVLTRNHTVTATNSAGVKG